MAAASPCALLISACFSPSERAIDAYQALAKTNNTMIVPGNMTEVSSLIATAMALIKSSAVKPA